MELKQGRVELLEGNSVAKIASNGLAQFLLQSTKHTHMHAHTHGQQWKNESSGTKLREKAKTELYL